MSTAIRSILQKAIFQPDEERLIAIAYFNAKNDTKKKKREIFVCLVGNFILNLYLNHIIFSPNWKDRSIKGLSLIYINILMIFLVSNEQPIAVRLYFVKTEKDNLFRKKDKFALRDVKVIDGINPRKVLIFLKSIYFLLSQYRNLKWWLEKKIIVFIHQPMKKKKLLYANFTRFWF